MSCWLKKYHILMLSLKDLCNSPAAKEADLVFLHCICCHIFHL